MARLFGTDGVRGIANVELTPELAFKLGRAAASYFGRETRNPKIIIGRDTRLSGTMLEAALAAGICSAGGNAHLLGVIPTPAVSYLTSKLHANAGAVISASHNPFEDNGIKFFSQTGHKLPDAVEDEIEARELARIIEAFLDTLTVKERVIFMRRYAYADTYADIAKRVGVSEKNVSVRLALIRQKMKKYLIKREVFV